MKNMKKVFAFVLALAMILTTYLFIAKVKYRKLQPPFVGNCRINGWGKCRF